MARPVTGRHRRTVALPNFKEILPGPSKCAAEYRDKCTSCGELAVVRAAKDGAGLAGCTRGPRHCLDAGWAEATPVQTREAAVLPCWWPRNRPHLAAL